MNSWIPMLFIYHLFDAHIVLDLAIDTLSGWLLWSFFMSPSFFDHLLFFLHSRDHVQPFPSYPLSTNRRLSKGFRRLLFSSQPFIHCNAHYAAKPPICQS